MDIAGSIPLKNPKTGSPVPKQCPIHGNVNSRYSLGSNHSLYIFHPTFLTNLWDRYYCLHWRDEKTKCYCPGRVYLTCCLTSKSKWEEGSGHILLTAPSCLHALCEEKKGKQRGHSFICYGRHYQSFLLCGCSQVFSLYWAAPENTLLPHFPCRLWWEQEKQKEQLSAVLCGMEKSLPGSKLTSKSFPGWLQGLWVWRACGKAGLQRCHCGSESLKQQHKWFPLDKAKGEKP